MTGDRSPDRVRVGTCRGPCVNVLQNWIRFNKQYAMQNLKAVLALFSVILPTALHGSQDCLIIGHRGASYDAPENTLASVNLAWAKGAAAAEIDVHLSADGQVVVVHDFNTKKLYGRDREVKDQTYAELLEL